MDDKVVIDISPEEKSENSLDVELEHLNVTLDTLFGMLVEAATGENGQSESLDRVGRIRSELHRRMEALSEIEEQFERPYRERARAVVDRIIYSLMCHEGLSEAWRLFSSKQKGLVVEKWTMIVEEAMEALG